VQKFTSRFRGDALSRTSSAAGLEARSPGSPLTRLPAYGEYIGGLVIAAHPL